MSRRPSLPTLISPGSSGWIEFTPTLNEGATNVTVTVQYSKYFRLNNLCIVTLSLLATSTYSAADAAINIGSLPFGSSLTSHYSAAVALGSYAFLNSGTAFYGGIVVNWSGNPGLAFYDARSTAANYFGLSPSYKVKTNDRITLTATYEII